MKKYGNGNGSGRFKFIEILIEQKTQCLQGETVVASVNQ